MAILIRIVATALLIAASWWLCTKAPLLISNSYVSEFQILVPFLAIVVFLSAVNWLTGLAGRES